MSGNRRAPVALSHRIQGGTVEVRIGIKDSPRELTLETDQPASEVRQLVEDAIGADTALITLTDSKGHQFLIATSSIAYMELGGETTRKVGFIS